MKGSDVPRSWRKYLDAIDKCLAEKGAPPPVRDGIVQDVEEHLRQLSATHPHIPGDELPGLLDFPEAYAEAFAEAVFSPPDSKGEVGLVRLRECHSRHGEDGKRRIHVCGNCLRVFQGCFDYETHICDGDFRRDGTYIPYWSHRKRWTTAMVIAALLFLPILWFLHDCLAGDPCGGNWRFYHKYSNISYLKQLVASIVTFQVQRNKEPENLQELVESGIWHGNWVMPGDLRDLGGEGGFATERLYYIHASGVSMSLAKNRQPWLVLPSRSRGADTVCYTVAYTDGVVIHYATLTEFLADWGAKQ